MGKKKASKARRLRPILERAIDQGEVYCSPVRVRYTDEYGKVLDTPEKESYKVMFGADASPNGVYWVRGEPRNIGDHVHVCVDVYSDGRISFYFSGNRDHMLDRRHTEWFIDQLEQIITMHKMGGYTSEQNQPPGPDDWTYSLQTSSGYYRSKRS